jgi:hypothetical protein
VLAADQLPRDYLGFWVWEATELLEAGQRFFWVFGERGDAASAKTATSYQPPASPAASDGIAKFKDRQQALD